MNIIKTHKYAKHEDINIYQFLEFYCNKLKKDVHFESIPETFQNKTADYYVPEIKAVIEVKGIHDRELNEEQARWNKIIKKLRTSLYKHTKIDQIKGVYLLNTPPVFKFPRNKIEIENAADKILESLINQSNSVDISGVTFEIEKVSNKDNEILFGSSSVGWINPVQKIHQNIFNIIEKANTQLNLRYFNKEFNNRILLLVNYYIYSKEVGDVIQGLSYAYEDLTSYQNIDEVWLQNPKRKSKPDHFLLYTKKFLDQLNSQKIEPTRKNAKLFQLWFSPLADKDNRYNEILLGALKTFLKTYKPYHQIFNDKLTRQEMVRIGIWLINEKRFEDVIWLIDQFIDDPDPEEPPKYHGDPEFNYHKQILENKDPKIITTVLGHLAWIIQKLALNNNYIVQSLEYTRKLLEHENLYVKLQTIIPLIEIARRRQVLLKYDEENASNKYNEFYETVFGLVREYAKYKAIAKWLVHIFYYFKDLTTEEALEVLDKLKVTEGSASLFIYFGIYRERHYKKPDGTDEKNFNPTPLKYKLNKMITSNVKRYIDLRANIAWNFKKVLDENPEEFDTTIPYVDLFLKQPYQKSIYDAIERIIEACIDRKPDICINWFEKIIDNTLIFSLNNTDEAKNIWRTPEKIISFIANYKPYKLIKIMEKLTNLWVNGAYIGSPKNLFESHKLISDLKLKADVKERFKELYKSMKYLNPKIEKVDWD